MSAEVSDVQRDALVEVGVPAADAAPRSLANASERPRLFGRLPLLRDIVEVMLVIAVIYTFVNLATARAIVEGTSMAPNFATGQLVIVNRFTYYFGQPERGDVIVLHNPRNNDEDYIKRVVGLPGEVVTINGGRVFVNGVRLEEPYIAETNVCVTMCEGTWSLAQDEYFVLGDNRRNSTDSHTFGPIKRELIVGKAWVRYWPLDQLSIIPHQNYRGQGFNALPADLSPTPGAPGFSPGRFRQNGSA